MATGDDQQLRQLKEWLKQGSEMARVTELKVEEVEYREFGNFSVR